MSIEVHRIVRERNFRPTHIYDTIVILRAERATGTLTIELNQGGIRAIQFREEAEIEHTPQNSLDKTITP